MTPGGLCFVCRQFELPLTSPDAYEHKLFSLSEIDHSKRHVNQFANMIHLEFRNNSASIRVDLKHFTVLQYSSHEIITDMWHILLFVIRLNTL